MNKIERNEIIVKLTKENKTNAEIIKAIKSLDDKMPISDDTIRKVRKDNGLTYTATNGYAAPHAKFAANNFVEESTFSDGSDFAAHPAFSTEELYKMIKSHQDLIESLQDEIIDLKDDLAIEHAKIQSIEADVIKASTVHCNELKSDKKYIIKRLSTREVIDYSNEDELGRYIKIFGSRIPVSTIDNSIRDNGKWMCSPDDIEITYTAEAALNDINYKSQMLAEQHSDLANKINNIMEKK